MNFKKIIDEVKLLFSNEEVETQKFEEVKTIDGEIIRAEVIQEGAALVKVTEEGEEQIQDGDYETTEGDVITVEDGVIKHIEENHSEDMESDKKDDEDEDDEEKKKKYSKRFSVKRRFTEADEVVETEGEMTLVVDEVEVGEKAVIIDEELNVEEAYSGELDAVIDDKEVVIAIVDGQIEDIVEAEAEVSEEAFDAVEFAKVLKSEFEKMIDAKLDVIKQNFEAEKDEIKKEVEKIAKQPAETNTIKTKFNDVKGKSKSSPIYNVINKKK